MKFVRLYVMQNISEKTDRRILRTRRALKEAMIDLIKEKHYDSITVQNIIDRANVGRSTFYSHFRDKEDLFRGDWEHFLTFFVQSFRWDNISDGQFVPMEGFLEHVKEFHSFYRGLVRSGKIQNVFEYGKRFLAKSIENELSKTKSEIADPLVPPPLLANYISEEFFSILKWWLDQNMPYSPHRMDQIFHTLVMPGIRLSLKTKVLPSERS